MSAESEPSASCPRPAAPVVDLRRGVILMTLSLVGFTANTFLIKYLSGAGVDITLTMSLRFAVGLAVALCFAPDFQALFQNRLLISRGVIGGLATAAMYVTIAPLGAGKAILISYTWCLFAALMAAAVLRERLTGPRVSGIVIAFIGLACLLEIRSGADSGTFLWEVIALVGAVMAAAVVVVIRQLTLTVSSATIFASQCVYGLVLSAPFALKHPDTVSGADWTLLLVAGASAAFAQLCMTEGFRHLTVAAGAAFQVLLPLMVAVCGVLFFGESFTGLQIVGAMLILSGSFAAVRR